MRSDRAGYEELIDWAVSVIDRLRDENAEPSAFIRAFARPIDLNSLPDTTVPSTFAVNASAFVEQLYDSDTAMQLVRGKTELAAPLNLDEATIVLAALSQSFTIRKVHGELSFLKGTYGLVLST